MGLIMHYAKMPYCELCSEYMKLYSKKTSRGCNPFEMLKLESAEQEIDRRKVIQ